MKYSTAKYFQDAKTDLRSVMNGYISEKDMDKSNIPDNAVVDVNNLDFFPDFTRRRLPYDLYFSASSYLPSGYVILGSTERTFVDSNGNSKTVLIFAAKHSSDSGKKLRIYMKGFYGAGAFNDDVIELTEFYQTNYFASETYNYEVGTMKKIENASQSSTCVITSTAHGYSNDDKIMITGVNGMKELNNNVYTVKNVTANTFDLWNAAASAAINSTSYNAYSGNGRIEEVWYISSVGYNLRINDSGINGKADDYFKEFIALGKSDSTNKPEELAGVVKKSKYDSGTGYTYFQVELGNGMSLTTDGGLCRYPVNNFNRANWSSITDIEFCNTTNALKIWTGHSSRPLWLGFLGNKKYFAQYSVGTQTVSNALWDSPPSSLTGRFNGNQAETFTFKITDVAIYSGITQSITAATQASPCKITITGHGYTTGDIGQITGVSGMTELNNRFFKITVLNANEFTLDGIDSSGYTAYTSGGVFRTSSFLDFLLKIQYQSNIDSTWKTLLNYVNIQNFDKWYYSFAKGLSIKFLNWGFGIGYEVDIPIEKGANEKSYDGFYFAYDVPEVLNKKQHILFENTGADGDELILDKAEIGEELGIYYRIKKNFEAVTSSMLYRQRIYSLVLQYDQVQGVFIKNLFCKRFDSGGQKVIPLDISVYFEPWFDRRITSHLLFYEQFDDDKAYQLTDQLPESRQLDDNANGFVTLLNMGANYEDSSYKADLLNGRYELKELANGKLLSTEYLNNYYMKNVVVKAKKAIEVGRNVIAINLSQDSVNTDEERELNIIRDGKSTICVSQVQRGNANTNSIMCSERLSQIIPGEELISGAQAIGSQYLLFTKNTAKWYELTEDSDLNIRTLATFFDKGLISDKALVRAVIGQNTQTGPVNAPLTTQFGGIFWASNDSIYMFVDNQPIDILEGRWKKEYQALSLAQKEATVAGYLPAMRDVFFYINSKIYLFNIDLKLWRKYTYSDTPSKFFTERNGDLYFISGAKIYKTEPENTAKWKDKVSETPAAITFSWSKYYNHGSSAVNKIADKFDIMYEIVTDTSLGEPLPGSIVWTSGSNDTSNDLLNAKTISLVGRTAHRQGMTRRKRCRYYRHSFASDSTAADIKILKIYQITSKAKLGKGTLTKF